MNRYSVFASYSPTGDLTVASICYVMMILMFFSYIRRSRSFKIFLGVVGLIVLAAVTDVTFYMLAGMGSPSLFPLAYGLRWLYHTILFTIFLFFIIYIAEVTELPPDRKRVYIALSSVLLAVLVVADGFSTLAGRGMEITGDGMAYKGQDVFMFGYVAFIAVIVVMMYKVRNRLYRRVMMGFYCTMAFSFIILAAQTLFGQTSFTMATFLYPVIAMFYIMHSNPYDVQLGAIDSKGFEDVVRYNYERKRDFLFMSVYLKDFDVEGKAFPNELRAVVRRFTSDYFRDAMLFLVGGGHVVLLFPRRRNPDFESEMARMLGDFRREFQRLGYEYKIVLGESVDEVSRQGEYVSFIRSVQRCMEPNSVHRVEPEDVQGFKQAEYILGELADICQKRDLDDPRVLAYCQPVFNVNTHKYDTAEALMRLKLDQLGLVFPDRFIPLAEENGYIHELTKIILHKTCLAVMNLLEAGYAVSRVSVNVSPLELKDDHFCEDIIEIIEASGVPGEKIAIELTESRNESDFLLMKNKISVLKQRGIKFYLDDFGTGYSSMERIMELPFDIIKFDRSMVIFGGADVRARKMVSSLASMFKGLNYSVLYEGVEDEADEQMCEDMAASYLQGYKYSRPVPINTLENFFERESA